MSAMIRLSCAAALAFALAFIVSYQARRRFPEPRGIARLQFFAIIIKYTQLCEVDGLAATAAGKLAVVTLV
jgi:hypothetical protein